MTSFRKSIEELFRAYGAVQPDRAEIYVQDLEAHPERWTDLEVQSGCVAARRAWKHASLPPIGVVIQACFAVREADQRYRREQDQKRDLAIDPDWIAENELAHCKLIRELYDAGLDYCDLTGKWLPYRWAVNLPPSDPRCVPMTIESTQAAVDRLRAGTLKGHPKVVAWRKSAGIAKMLAGAVK